MADLAALRELYAWMQENPRVLHARVGELELRLGSPPASLDAPSEQPESPPDSPEVIERRELETLLHSSGADVTPFLRRGAA